MKNSNSIQIGVVGVGHLGNFHVKQLSKIPEVEISGKAQVKPQSGPGIGCTPERSQLEKHLMESHKL